MASTPISEGLTIALWLGERLATVHPTAAVRNRGKIGVMLAFPEKERQPVTDMRLNR